MTVREKSNKRKGPLSDHVYASIKNAITAQRQPDERLMDEMIASDMGASRIPVGEALQKLEKEGLIFRRPENGFVIKGTGEEGAEDIRDLQCLLEGQGTSRFREDH